jgi:hypothetical protein
MGKTHFRNTVKMSYICGKERNVAGCQVNLSPALLSSLLPLGGTSSSLNVTGNQHKSDYSQLIGAF